MPVRLADIAAVAALATIVTIVLAAPVLRAPSQRVFGAELVGRHHDPFTAMQQFLRPLTNGAHAQPITDVTGALIARVTDPVAVYNWLVLVSFPLAAVMAYLLARHMVLAHAGATVAAMAFAFSPFHLAHAAYHPHIAQVQWLPLYLFALWRAVDVPTPGAIAALWAAAAAVVLSNFYGGFIAAVITPVAIGAYWTLTHGTRPIRRLAVTAASMAIVVAAGAVYAWWAAEPVVKAPTEFAVSQGDLSRYGATWWVYLMPPVEHPLLGPATRRVWAEAGVRDGLLEQQVSLGWGIVALAGIAIVQWVKRDRASASLARVPIIILVALVAFVCSLAPDQTMAGVTLEVPATVLHQWLPMFRSYARFGVIVQLMAALLAGIAVDALLRSGGRARLVCAALLVVAVAEYAVTPSSLWRDALPTAAHRWVLEQPEGIRVVDCVPRDEESVSVPWLTKARIAVLSESISDCAEPNVAQKLAANDFTHLLVSPRTISGRVFPATSQPEGLRLVATFHDSRVYAVAAARPVVFTDVMNGFSPREHDAHWSWRWMGRTGTWTVDNTTLAAVAATLQVELSAFHRDRRLVVFLNNRHVATIIVEPGRHTHRIGPLLVSPGANQLRFQPSDAATTPEAVMNSRDRRPLSVAVGSWVWTIDGDDR